MERILLALRPKARILHTCCSLDMSLDLTLHYQWYMQWCVILYLVLRTPPLVCCVGMGLIYDQGGCYETLHAYGVVYLLEVLP